MQAMQPAMPLIDRPVELIRDVHPRDAGPILEIYRPIVASTAISLESDPPTVAEMTRRIQQAEPRWPWLVMQGPGRLFGFAHASQFQSCDAFRYSAQTQVYVHPDDHGEGVGRMLMEALLQRLRGAGHHMAIASITLPNPAGIALHEALGFEQVGIFREVARKFFAWHDVGYWALDLEVSR